MDKQIISFLRFPLLLGVLFIHSYNNPANPLNLFERFISFGLAEVCVPTYFFISGYLFFKGIKQFDYVCYRNKIVKRLFSLFIPFVIWNLIPVFLVIFSNILQYIIQRSELNNLIVYLNNIDWANLFWDDHYYMKDKTFNIFGWPIKYTFTHNGPMWYLRDLIVICILSPVIYLGVVKLRIIGLLLLGLLYILMIYPYITLEFRGIFLFYLGAYFAINKINLPPPSNRGAILLIFLFAIGSLLSFSIFTGAICSITHNLYSIFGTFACFVISAIFIKTMPDSTILFINKLGTYAFFTYALHKCFLIKYIGILLNRLTDSLIASYILTPFVTFVICVAIYEILSKCTPKLLKVLVGGRINN